MRSRFLGSLLHPLHLGLLVVGSVAPLAAQTTVQWQTAVSGNWFTAGNWNPAVVPDFASPNSYRATISATGAPYVVTADGTNIDLAGFDVSSANARVFFDFTPANIGLTLASGSSTWSAGIVEFGNARLVGASNTATTVNIGGAAQLLFTTNTGNRTISSLALNNSGLIRTSTGMLSLSSVLLNNQATAIIHADGAEIIFQSNVTLGNSGILRATGPNGILRFQGPTTTAGLGTVELIGGGRALLQSTLNNSGNTLAAPVTSGSYELVGGTISGGTIAAGAVTFSGTIGTLSGTTLTGNLLLPTTSTYVALANNATFTGTNLTLGTSTQLHWQQDSTLVDKTLTFGSGALLYIVGINSKLTLDVDSSATGNIQILSDGNNGTTFTNQGSIINDGDGGQIYARSFFNAGTITSAAVPLSIGLNSSSYLTTNTGTITADGSGALVTLNGSVDNNGTLLAQNQGILRFSGSNTTANLGIIQLVNNGRVQLNGTLDNSGQTLTAFPGLAGVYELLGGTINGGTVAPGALTFTNSTGTLAGVTFQGDLTLPSNTYVNLSGSTTVGGSTITLGSGSQLHWQQSGTLSGKAIAFTGGGLIFLSGGANHPLTLASNTTATGSISIYTDGSIGNNVTNLGTLTHTGSTGQLYAHQFLNGGTISATGGSFNLGVNATGYTFANSVGGTINVAGANVSVNAAAGDNFLNQGLINVQSGTLFTNGKLLNDDPGTIRGAGTIQGGLTMAGGTLEPGNSIGTLTLNGGAFSITDATVFAFELGGSTADRLLFVNPTAPVNLGAGLVTLSLTLLSAPTQNATYNFLQISSGGSGITGTFANVPVTGSTLTADFGGTSYLFAITYQTNLVSLQAVPEPGTYALIGAGLAAMWVLARRRRR